MNCPHWTGKTCKKYNADCPVEGCTILKAYEEYRSSLSRVKE